MIGFVGAPWTILVYMINKISPKNNLSTNFFDDKNLIHDLLNIIEKFLISCSSVILGLYIIPFTNFKNNRCKKKIFFNISRF